MVSTFIFCNFYYQLARLFPTLGHLWEASWANNNHSVYKVFEPNVSTQPAITLAKLTIETLEQSVKYVQSQRYRSGVFTINFEHILHFLLVFL